MYKGYFINREDVISNFEITDAELEGCTILLAVYGCEYYEGSAFVLFEKDGVLYEVNGSHCSCYGLEGQWNPEETDCATLYHRATKGNLGYTHDCEPFADELLAIIRGRWGLTQ